MDRTSIMSRGQSNVPLPALMPRPTTMTMPSLPATSQALHGGVSGVGAMDTGLTPDLLVQRLPSIVNPDPVVPNPGCSAFEQWVADYPFMAAMGLVAVAYFTMKGGKGK